jgi:transcriptional regulator with XRE-family HTH domain
MDMLMLSSLVGRPPDNQGSAIPGSFPAKVIMMFVDRVALGGFLRRRRESLRPEGVGLPAGGRRRAQGLRREEVAELAGMSTDYYTRLEQQRGPQPSQHVLASLARALRMTTDERNYLFETAGHNAPAPVSALTRVSPGLLAVLESLDDTPAVILSRLGEMLVQNRMSVALIGDTSLYTGMARIGVYRWFTDPSERRLCPEEDRDHRARGLVAMLRATYGSMGPRSGAGELVRALLEVSEEFAELWERHEVQRPSQEHKTIIHPELGAIGLDCQILTADDQSQSLLVFTAPRHTPDHEKLRMLAEPLARAV